jgi:hypothetical protein
LDIPELGKMTHGGDRRTGYKRKLALNNIPNIKRSLARLVRDCDNEPSPDLNKYKVLATLLNSLIGACRLDVEQRIERIEAYIDESKTQNT